jgi:glucosyl-dolichyl phosphate glucuronosyltransferase
MNITDKKIDISVVICVYNGGELFKKNIESVSRLKAPESTRVEIILVDNNSTDGSAEITKDYVRRYPDTFRYFNETNQGLSHAKNLALRKAGGEIIAFTDADTLLPEDWLLRIKEGFEKHDCVALGGRVLPVWEIKPPRWFLKETNNGNRCGVLSLWNSGETEYYPLKKGPSFPTGCNSAVKKEAFLKYGGYRTELGIWPGLRLGGEETEFFYRISIAGEKLLYYPQMTVYHQIPKKRITKRYLGQNSFVFLLSSLYKYSFYPNRIKSELPKNLTSFPEILLKFFLSGFSRKLTTHSNFHYRIRMQNIICELSYRLFGLDNTIKLAKISRFLD